METIYIKVRKVLRAKDIRVHPFEYHLEDKIIYTGVDPEGIPALIVVEGSRYVYISPLGGDELMLIGDLLAPVG